MQNQACTPEFLPVEIHFGFVLHLAAQILAPRRVNHLCKPPADRLYPQIDLQISGNRSARWRIDQNKKGSNPNIRMGPQRNDTRPNALIHNNRKWRTVMPMRRWCIQHSEPSKNQYGNLELLTQRGYQVPYLRLCR